MRTQIFILLYGVVVTAYGYPVYDYDDYEGFNMNPDQPYSRSNVPQPYAYNNDNYFTNGYYDNQYENTGDAYDNEEYYPRYESPMKTIDIDTVEKRSKVPVFKNGKEDVMAELRVLQNDVSGFSNSMENMAEALIIGKKKHKYKHLSENNSVVKNSEKKTKVMLKEIVSGKILKAQKKTDDARKKFEDELVTFYTGYICGKDCK